MTTHPGRLTAIITGMVPAFAGLPRPHDVQVAEAVELVLAKNPTLEELADAREALLERSQEIVDFIGAQHDELEATGDLLRDRARKAEALAIAEERVRDASA